MSATQIRKMKVITFTLGATTFECQLSKWMMNNNTTDGDKLYTFCATNSESREDAEADYSLDLTFFADWRSGGISDYLTVNGGTTAAFQIDHHPDIVGEYVRWTGNVKLRKPNVGGEARTNELTEITLVVIGEPVYTRP